MSRAQAHERLGSAKPLVIGAASIMKDEWETVRCEGKSQPGIYDGFGMIGGLETHTTRYCMA